MFNTWKEKLDKILHKAYSAMAGRQFNRSEMIIEMDRETFRAVMDLVSQKQITQDFEEFALAYVKVKGNLLINNIENNIMKRIAKGPKAKKGKSKSGPRTRVK